MNPSKEASIPPGLGDWLEWQRRDSDRVAEDSQGLYGHGAPGDQRFSNLREYMRLMYLRRPTVLLVGEAPGHRGSRRSGIPFVSEALLENPQSDFRTHFAGSEFALPMLSDRASSEQSASVVWREISALGLIPLLWAAYPRHPHEVGNAESNRTPTRSEVKLYSQSLHELIELFRVEQIIAVGNVASSLLDSMSIRHVKIRHPAHGGVTKFQSGLRAYVTQSGP
jgi:uracil-DNA glycosylase